MFVMRNRANSMSSSCPTSTFSSENVWFLDSFNPITWSLMKIGSESSESPNDPAMWKLGRTPFTQFCMSVPIQWRGKLHLHQEWFACSNNNEESDLSRPDRRARHASSVQWRRLLHWKKRPNYRSWSKRRPSVYPRVERGKIGNVCQGPQSRCWHRAMPQKDRPHQSLEAQRHAVERSRHQTPHFYIEGDCYSVQSLPIRTLYEDDCGGRMCKESWRDDSV